MTIIYETTSLYGALMELTVGDITLYSFNREYGWYTDLTEALQTARKYWEWKSETNEAHNITAGMMFEKIDQWLSEIRCGEYGHEWDDELPPRCTVCGEMYHEDDRML